MKRFFPFIIIIWSFGINATGQSAFSILFVNDNAVFAPNTTAVMTAIQQNGFSFSTFDAVAHMRSPTFDEMKLFDLVIWYTSTDGVGLYFWNGAEEDNPHLISYLESGGNLVVMGNDFLYDRYTTPYTFQPGSFVHDFMGTLTYYAQSYGDDGFVGLPQLDLLPGQTIATLNPVQWVFPTLWWADACVPLPSAIPVYKMGPITYPLSNYFSAIYYQGSNFSTLSLFFDPALINTDANRANLMGSIINHFQNLVTLRENITLPRALRFSPSVFAQCSSILLPENNNSNEIRIFDSMGRMVKRQMLLQGTSVLPWDASDLRPGYYTAVAYPEGISGRFTIVR